MARMTKAQFIITLQTMEHDEGFKFLTPHTMFYAEYTLPTWREEFIDLFTAVEVYAKNIKWQQPTTGETP